MPPFLETLAKFLKNERVCKWTRKNTRDQIPHLNYQIKDERHSTTAAEWAVAWDDYDHPCKQSLSLAHHVNALPSSSWDSSRVCTCSSFVDIRSLSPASAHIFANCSHPLTVYQQTSAQQRAQPAAQILGKPLVRRSENQQQLQSVETAAGLELSRAECLRRSQEQQLELLWKEVGIKEVELAAELMRKKLKWQQVAVVPGHRATEK